MPEDSEVAEILGLKTENVSNLRVGMQWPINIDQPIGGEDGNRTYRDIIPDTAPLPDVAIDQDQMINLIKRSLASLTAQEERVLRLRFGISESESNHDNFPIMESEFKQLKGMN